MQHEALEFWRQHGTVPPCFQVADRGLVPGAQTIARAELCAALQAVRSGSVNGRCPLTVVTDSSYVMRTFKQMSAGNAAALRRSAENVDLLCLLEEVWYEPIPAVKVKSHQKPEQVQCSQQLWHVLGNMAADQACDMARAADLSVVVEMVHQSAQEHKPQAKQLRQVFDYSQSGYLAP